MSEVINRRYPEEFRRNAVAQVSYQRREQLGELDGAAFATIVIPQGVGSPAA